MTSVCLQLPDDVSSRLLALEKRTGRSSAFYMVEAINQHLDDLEDLYLAEQRLAEHLTDKEAPTPLEVLMQRHGVAD